MTTRASFPPYTVTVPKPLKAHREVADPELGGLKHVLLQMQDEALREIGIGDVEPRSPPNCDGLGPYN